MVIDNVFSNKISAYVTTENHASPLGFNLLLLGSIFIAVSFGVSYRKIFLTYIAILIPFILLDNAYLMIRAAGLLPITWFFLKLDNEYAPAKSKCNVKNKNFYFSSGALVMALITVKPLIFDSLSPQYIY